jgi:hypothetical protein
MSPYKRHIRVTNISASTIKYLLTVSILYCDLIIDQKRSLLDQLCLKRTSLDAAERVFIYSNKNFEARVKSVTTHQNQSSYSRGCNTEDNGTLGTKCIAESVVDIGLASFSRTMKKKALARVSVYSMHDLVKGRALVRIEIEGTIHLLSTSLVPTMAVLLLLGLLRQL